MEEEEKWVNGNVELLIGGEPLQLNFTVPAKPVQMRRMLPVFQKMSDRFNGIVAENLKAEGKEISCKAGCGACCRHAVPITEDEAFNLKEVFDGLPEERKAEVRRRFDEGMKKLNAISFFERLDISQDESEVAKMVREYFRQGIPCPFLENESCSIHESRPIACREYLVTSPAENCSSPTAEGVENVQYLLKVKRALIAISSRHLPGKEITFVPLIRLLDWSKNNKTDNSEELEGTNWMRKFFAELIGQSRMPHPSLEEQINSESTAV